MEQEIKTLLGKLTDKKNIYLVKRGNNAIKQLTNLFKDKIFLIPDQGGWITYYQYPKHFIYYQTDYGLLKNDINFDREKYVLLINSNPGYFALQDIKTNFKGLIINDASGSIGYPQSKKGEIIFGSFGEDKIIDLGYGGFIATNLDLEIKEEFEKEKLGLLYEKLKNIKKRISFLENIHKKIKTDLKNYGIIHKNIKGINVIVKFNNEKEKQEIENYCRKNNYEFTLCPRYIRVRENAVSIEVKRLKC
ncbi:MAG: hypothetical protein PHG05_00575 [Candidatus Nanoarchaeia archaeon]|nr:hypothetical protein [Candidatus Nanoarchaeia archaeon]